MPKATTAVISPAGNSGMPKSRFSAIAAPTNSARSVAMATSSRWIHSRSRRGAGSARGTAREVATGGDADLRRQVLDEHRDQVGRDDDPQQQ